MTKHFKTKRKLRHDIIIKYLIILLISYIVIKLCIILLFNSSILNYLFKHNKIKEYKEYVSNNTINKPSHLLSYEIKDYNELVMYYKINNKSIVYIYNTHQTEAYQKGKTVLDAAHLLKEGLAKYNIQTYVEETNITEFMRTNNISYNYSYYASKFFVQEAIKNYKPNLIIDLHRDAISKDASTITINNKKYAKIMFVVGEEHKNYKENYALATQINNLIKKKYPSLTRGVLLKGGKNNNGIYNQDLARNIILIELGGNYNTFEEVSNTINLLSEIIGEYLHG